MQRPQLKCIKMRPEGVNYGAAAACVTLIKLNILQKIMTQKYSFST